MWGSAAAFLLAAVAGIWLLLSGRTRGLEVVLQNNGQTSLSCFQLHCNGSTSKIVNIPPGAPRRFSLRVDRECGAQWKMDLGEHGELNDFLGYVSPEMAGHIYLLLRSNKSTVQMTEVQIPLF
jgi:hypothetical protein